MAHELTRREDGSYEFVFAGATPWHQLGQRVDDVMDPMEALVKAQLDWEVSLAIPSFATDEGIHDVPNKRVTYRADTGTYLGTVGLQYKPLQNREQAEFLRALVGEGGKVEVAGSLRQGKRTFWTVKAPGETKVHGEDPVDRYLILANGHDGTMSFRAFWSPIRVVCQNTLSASLRGAKDGVTIRHTSNVKSHVKEAQQILGLADQWYKQASDHWEAMFATKVDQDQAGGFLESVFGMAGDSPAAQTKREGEVWKRTLGDLKQCYVDECQAVQADPDKPTVWRLYNTVTRYTSHNYAIKQQDRDYEERKFNNVLFGQGRKTADRAFTKAMELVAA